MRRCHGKTSTSSKRPGVRHVPRGARDFQVGDFVKTQRAAAQAAAAPTFVGAVSWRMTNARRARNSGVSRALSRLNRQNACWSLYHDSNYYARMHQQRRRQRVCRAADFQFEGPGPVPVSTNKVANAPTRRSWVRNGILLSPAQHCGGRRVCSSRRLSGGDGQRLKAQQQNYDRFGHDSRLYHFWRSPSEFGDATL
jgi:hypothetical protein